MRIFLPFIVVLIYWLLDAYQTMSHLNISYKQAVLLEYNRPFYLIKIAISFMIFVVIFFLFKDKQEPDNKETPDLKQLNSIYKISEVILAPLPLRKQLSKVVDILEDELEVQAAFIASFDKDTILVLNTNESLAKIGIKNQYLPYQNQTNNESLESLLSHFFVEKREFVDELIQIKGVKYRVVIQSYKYTHIEKNLGMIVLILKPSDDQIYTNFLAQIAEQIAFSINLTKKKEATIQSQIKYNEQFSLIDTQLHIMNNSKFQEMMEHELKRSQRYGTQLSLMILKIDYMKNLSNIFTEEEILTLRKEIVSLMKKNIRETDIFGKLDEEHFAILAPNIDYRATKSFATKLNNQLAKHRFQKVGKITCSYGITSFCAKDSIGSFRKRAEHALKEALEKGGNSIEIKILV